MSAKPKIVVFQLKELIYTAIFVILGILLILLLIFMFLPKDSDSDDYTADATYNAGVYTSSLVINNTPMEIEVIVDTTNIKSVKVSNLSEAVTTMFPLVSSAIDDISEQVVAKQSLENISYTEDNQYTYMVLIEGIKSTLTKAYPEAEENKANGTTNQATENKATNQTTENQPTSQTTENQATSEISDNQPSNNISEE